LPFHRRRKRKERMPPSTKRKKEEKEPQEMLACGKEKEKREGTHRLLPDGKGRGEKEAEKGGEGNTKQGKEEREKFLLPPTFFLEERVQRGE